MLDLWLDNLPLWRDGLLTTIGLTVSAVVIGFFLAVPIGAARAEHHLVTVRREHAGRRFADAAAGARDEDDLGHDAFSWWVGVRFRVEKVWRCGPLRSIPGAPG